MIWTLSNIISGIRALLAIPLAYFIINDEKIAAVATIIIIVISDVADGWVARRRNEITEYGKIIDPLADKIVAGTSIICMFADGIIPAWFFWTVLGRDAAIIILGAIAARKTRFVLPSNYAGKLTVVLIAISLTLYLVFPPSFLLQSILVIATAAMAYSMISYGARFLRHVEKMRSP